MRKKTKFYNLTNVKVLTNSSEGYGIIRHEEKVIFVSDSIKGDEVDIEVKSSKKKYDTATITKIIKPSEYRKTPYCSDFDKCGGCSLQHMDYKYQLQLKEDILKDALNKITKIDIDKIENIIPAKKIKEYRNKLDFAVSNNRWLEKIEIESKAENIDKSAIGFHKKGMYDKIIDIHNCHHMSEPMNDIKNFIRQKAKELNIEFYNIRTREGIIRNILIRKNINNKYLLCLSFNILNQDVMNLMEAIKINFKEVESILYTHNTKVNDTIYDLKIEVYSGNEYIIENLGSLKFKINAKSFFQTNTDQCIVLYDLIKKEVLEASNQIVYDLYCGVGSIGIYLADSCNKIVGIELVEEAINDAKENVKLNNITNCHFFANDINKLFDNNFVLQNGNPDTIVLDPPRNGLDKKVIEQLLNIKAKRLVYVSCNPFSLANNLIDLLEVYQIKKIQPVDMFPQTLHLETIVTLDIKN